MAFYDLPKLPTMRYKRHLPHWLPEGAILRVSWSLAGSSPSREPEILRSLSRRTGPCGTLWRADARIARMDPEIEVPAIMPWLKVPIGRIADRIFGRSHQLFWHEDSYHHIIRSVDEFTNTIRYIDETSLTAGFAESPDQWQWSSASALHSQPKPMACRTRGTHAW